MYCNTGVPTVEMVVPVSQELLSLVHDNDSSLFR